MAREKICGIYRIENLINHKKIVDEKIFVDINGTKMGMIIKSKDISNPVLLFVHGGPGMPEYFLNYSYSY